MYPESSLFLPILLACYCWLLAMLGVTLLAREVAAFLTEWREALSGQLSSSVEIKATGGGL